MSITSSRFQNFWPAGPITLNKKLDFKSRQGFSQLRLDTVLYTEYAGQQDTSNVFKSYDNGFSSFPSTFQDVTKCDSELSFKSSSFFLRDIMCITVSVDNQRMDPY